jgi:bifunctional UDP-N-acetylglucosamine pyrophosphorylase/glucosamine-1-phosphate N-acetyltransferase
VLVTDDPDHLRGEFPETEVAAVVLAAGKGTRMVSEMPKVLHPLAGRPMLLRVLRMLGEAGFSRPAIVVGYGADHIHEVVGEGYPLVVQEKQLGTGDAARLALEALPSGTRLLAVMHGDEPLLPPKVLEDMLMLQGRTSSPVVLLTTLVEETRGFGRVVRNEAGAAVALVQESELSEEQRRSREVNLGAYVFDAAFLRETLPRLAPHSPKGEYFLTDVIGVAANRAESGEGLPVETIQIEGGTDIMGINDLAQLEEAGRRIYRETNRRHMLSGVTIVDSASTFIDDEVEIGADTVIQPFTILQGSTSIGRRCRIGPNVQVHDSTIGDGSRILASTLEGSTVGAGVTVGPYSHLRAGARVEDGAEIGNYAEIKNSSIGRATRMHHVGYIGDAEVGADVNIGAGTITGNFDGHRKHRTVIEDNAFIGIDTMLRAPVRVGEGASTGAGSVVLHDVPPGAVVAGVPARAIRKRRAEEKADASEERT